MQKTKYTVKKKNNYVFVFVRKLAMCLDIKILKILSLVIAVVAFICGIVLIILECILNVYKDIIKFIIIIFTCINELNAVALIFGTIWVSRDILFGQSND